MTPRPLAILFSYAVFASCACALPANQPRPVAPQKTGVVLLVGKGPATLQAKFSAIAGARIEGKPFRTLERAPLQEGLRINTYEQSFPDALGKPVRVNFVLLRLDQERAKAKIDGKIVGLDRGFTLNLQLSGGFHVGQVFPVISATERDQSHFRGAAVLRYAESCFSDAVRGWGGNWNAIAGQVRITGVKRDHLAFELQNVRFQGSSDPGAARGTFTVNGRGAADVK